MPKRIRLLFSGLSHQQFIQSLRLWWVSQDRFYRHLLSNLIIGIPIAVLLHSSNELPWLRQAEDNAVDWVMSMQRGVNPVRSAMPIVFLDIDEAAYLNWNEPLHIPRNKLLNIIQFAVSGNPALIVVDVDLSRQGQFPKDDRLLANFLSKYNGRCKPPIILPQLFRKPLIESSDGKAKPPISLRTLFKESFTEPLEEESARILREPFFIKDNFGEDSRVFFASPLFELDESDFRLRRWRLWETTSNTKVIPSVELLAVAFFKQPYRNSLRVNQNVIEELTKLIPAETTLKLQHSDNSTTANIADLKLNSETKDIGQRILYTIPWRLGEGEAYPVNFARRSVLPISKNEYPSSENHPDEQCAMTSKAKSTQLPDTSWLEGRTVVIGASFEESRDLYATPIGQMPGAMVIVNAINSLYEHGLIEKPKLLLTIFIQIVLIILMSVIFAFFDPFLGMLISSVVIISIMLPLSFTLFKYGFWLDFAIPLIAIKLYRMYSSFNEKQDSCISKS